MIWEEKIGLGIRIGHNGNNGGFGNLCNLRIITTDDDDTNKIQRKKIPKTKTRIIGISEPIYQLLRNHSHKYHDQPISYDYIFEELCKFYNEHHEQKYWF